MVLDANILQEKLIEAWKLRSDETSFSASLTPLVAECQSEEEFRTLLTKQILNHIDSVPSSNLLQSYFKFHTRSGYVNESLVIERLLSLTPATSSVIEDVQMKFLLELLLDTLKTLHVTAEKASHLGRQINSLAKWLCSALTVYSNEDANSSKKELLIAFSNLFLLLFTNTSFYCLWLMTIKAQREQTEWRHIQDQLTQTSQKMIVGDSNRPDIYEQVLSKITRLHLSEDFHQEEIEINSSIFHPIVSMLVVNKLHKSSSILLTILRFYETVSTTLTPSLLYLRLLQASFGGYVASISTNNSEYQQRWSAYLFFQLPRLLASCFETQLDHVKEAVENFLLHNEYLLHRMDDLCSENVLEQLIQTSLSYTKSEVRERHQTKIDQLISYIQRIRGAYVQKIQQHHLNQQSYSYSYQILQTQRSLEQTLFKIFSSENEDHLQLLVDNLTDFIPLICALDQYYSFIRLLLSYIPTQFDLALLILCYLTSITDDISEDFGHIELNFEKSSSSYQIYIWLKKYWLSRYYGHALFASSLDSIDLLSTMNNPLNETSSTDKENFRNEIKISNQENHFQKNLTDMEYLNRTIHLLGELPSLSLDETKQTVSELINYLTQVSYGSLVHVLLWLIANHQIANDDERIWIQSIIHSMGSSVDSTSTSASLLDAIKRQLWSDFIDNPLLPYYTSLPLISSSSTAIVNNYTLSTPQSATTLIVQLFDTFIASEFFDCEQSRALYISSKYVSTAHILSRLFTTLNTSNGIYETRRGISCILAFILFRRRSSTRSLMKEVLPCLINIKSNEFMLEPNVYSMCFLLNILLILEFQTNTDQLEDLFRVKSWKQINQINNDSMVFDTVENQLNELKPIYEDTSVLDAYHQFLDWSSKELFSSDSVRPVNYFIGWFQTILWMFSRTTKVLKPFIKSKLIAQLSEYLPLQFPIEKVLSILDFSTSVEIEYTSMVITRDYERLQTTPTRATHLVNNQETIDTVYNAATSMNISKNIYAIPRNL